LYKSAPVDGIARLFRRSIRARRLSLQDLAEMYNPCIRGWINYYSHFYKTQLRPTLKRIDLYVIRGARRKFKRLRRKTKGARDWFDRLRRVNPTLFAHWQLCHGNGRTSGAV
jgi:RNA-directed DNA polymerase